MDWVDFWLISHLFIMTRYPFFVIRRAGTQLTIGLDLLPAHFSYVNLRVVFFSHSKGGILTAAWIGLFGALSFVYLRALPFISHSDGRIVTEAWIGTLTTSLFICLSLRVIHYIVIRKD